MTSIHSPVALGWIDELFDLAFLDSITRLYVQIWHHAKRKGGVVENGAISLKVCEEDLAGVFSHNLKNHCKYFV